MKISITFKDPDALSNAFEDADIDPTSDYGEKIQMRLSKWLTYDEYVVMVYDTETDTLEIRKTGF
jgi:hypothetical protein